MATWKELVRYLDHRNPLPSLSPSSVWDDELSQNIIIAEPAELVDNPEADAKHILSTKAGLLLWNDDLNASHEMVQQLDTTEGNYWHAIMHRREGDYSNAKYWFAKIGDHSIHDTLYQQAIRLWPESAEWKRWSADDFVDAVADAVEQGEETVASAEALRRIQVVEISMLLRHVLLSIE